MTLKQPITTLYIILLPTSEARWFGVRREYGSIFEEEALRKWMMLYTLFLPKFIECVHCLRLRGGKTAGPLVREQVKLNISLSFS